MFWEKISLETIQLAAGGDELSWEKIYEGTWRFVCAGVSARLRPHHSMDDVEDVAQDVFKELGLRALHTYDPARSSFESYLMGITRNVVKNFFAKSANRIVTQPFAEGFDPGDANDDLRLKEEKEEGKAAFWQSLHVLTDRERQVMTLLFRDGKTPEEAAGILGVTTNTVASTKSHALAKLKKIFGTT